MNNRYEHAIVDLIEMVRNGTIGPISVGSNLSMVGDLLGVPKYWGFADEKEFSAYMGFGGVEVHFECEDNRVVVKYMQIELFAAKSTKIPFCHGGRLGAEISISIPTVRRRYFNIVRRTLLDAGLTWSEEPDEPITDETSQVMYFNNGVRLYFSKLNGNPLDLISFTGNRALFDASRA